MIVQILASTVLAVNGYSFYIAYTRIGYPLLFGSPYVWLSIITSAIAVAFLALYRGPSSAGTADVPPDQMLGEDVEAESLWEKIDGEAMKPSPPSVTHPPVSVNGDDRLGPALEKALADAISSAKVQSDLGIHLEIGRKRLKLGGLDAEIYGSAVFTSPQPSHHDGGEEDVRRDTPPPTLTPPPNESINALLRRELARLKEEE